MSEHTFTIYLIHHSHTDIGYTDYQEKIEMHHVHFIKEAIDILNAAHQGKEEWLGFKWNCESFWCVEKFLEYASQEEIHDLIKYIQSGEIGLSGNYLNLTDLVDERVLRDTFARSVETMRSYNLSMKSGMTADINGYSWGYADALADHGIENLMSCIHSHHGYHPLFKKQTPFYWQSPKGNKVLVWNGEHYLVGNELGITQVGEYEYTIRDNFTSAPLDKFTKAEQRIEAYVRVLQEEGHPYPFVPLSISGRMTDNAPPNTKIIEFVKKYNRLHSDQIRLEMVTLDEFFTILKSNDKEIPTYSGDWTDWWADGVGSTPNVVQHYREASRKLDMAHKLDPNFQFCSKELLDKASYNLMFYAEHTWGYSSSVSEPWHPGVSKLDLRKSLYAQKANEYASRACDQISFANGETPFTFKNELSIIAMNPHDIRVTDMIQVEQEVLYNEHFEVVDDTTGQTVPYQIGSYSRGKTLNILATLEPHEKKQFSIRITEAPPLLSSGHYAPIGIDGVNDLSPSFKRQLNEGSVVTPYYLENSFFRIQYSQGEGIYSVLDKRRNQELIRSDAPYRAFTPIYEVTDVTTTQCDERQRMGRNRKATSTRRYEGKLRGVDVLEDGGVYSRIELHYDLEGTSFCSLLITAFKDIPRIDIDFRCHKDSVWNPENLYLALPFTTGQSDEELWIDKTGAVLRPRIDQIPGSCTDFYAVQNGLCLCSSKGSIAVATPDTPLLMMGDIKSHEIKLAGEPGVHNLDHVYAWIMNNFWETNFKVDLGGFHQYRYTLMLSDSTHAADVLKQAKVVNTSVLGFQSYQ